MAGVGDRQMCGFFIRIQPSSVSALLGSTQRLTAFRANVPFAYIGKEPRREEAIAARTAGGVDTAHVAAATQTR